jgi:hypothetical protein
MTNPWFRMYNDFVYDEIIEMLAFEDQRHFIFILCLKNIGILDKDYPKQGMLDIVVGKRLGLYGESLVNAKLRLMDFGLIDEYWQPTNWNKRQFISDSDTSNAERQRRFRERKKEESDSNDSVTLRNVTVTPLETDTDTDTDTEQNLYTPENVSGLQKTKKLNHEIELLKKHGVEGKVAIDFLVVRKKKKLPLTETAMDGIIEEAEKANLSVLQAVTISTKKGWGGFDSTWNWPGKAKCDNTNNFNPVPGRYTPTTEDIYADF